MSIYAKLNAARAAFHNTELKKSGHNKFAGYDYFELGDFLVPGMRCMADAGLCPVISFGDAQAVMRIVDVDKPEDAILIATPMSEANLKGCHPVQNLGAVQTYLRRYLWVAALEIVEHDAIDSSKSTEEKGLPVSIKHRPADGAIVDKSRVPVVMAVVNAVLDHAAQDDIAGALEEIDGLTDPEEKTLAWDKLPSKVRTAITKYRNSLQEAF